MTLEKNNENLNFKKDDSGVVINKNSAELEQYLIARERIKKTKIMESRISNLENNLNDIHSKLNLILEKING